MNRLLLIALLILAPQLMRAQSFAERTAAVPAVSEKLDTADYPWNYPYRSKAEMINDMPPRISRRYRTTASLFEGPQRVDYLWMNNCPAVSDGDSVIASGSGAGCWYRTTFPVIVGDSVYIYRKGNVLRIDVAAMDSFMRAILGSTPAGQIQNSDIAHWNRVYTSWLGDSTKLVRIDRTYTDPSWLNVSPGKVGAATPSYVDAGVATLKAYSDNTFQAKGPYLISEVDGSATNELQSLSLAGNNLSLTSGNTVVLPKFDTTAVYARIQTVDQSATNEIQALSLNGANLSLSMGGGTVAIPQTTTLPYSAITATPTIPTQTSQLTNNSGFLTADAPTNLTSLVSGSNVTVNSSTGTGTTFAVPTTTYTYSNTPSRSIVTTTGATGYQLSATRPVFVSYSVTHTIALTLVLSSGSSTVFLETSPTNAAPWTTISSAGYTDGVAVAVALTKAVTNNVQGYIAPGAYCRLRAVTSGGGSAALANGQECTQ